VNTDLNLKAIRTCDHLIDVVIGLIASWTLAFHFSKLFNLERDATLITGIVVFLTVTYFLFNNLEKHKNANDPPSFTSTQNKSHTVIFLSLIAVSALLAWVDLDGLLWPLAWILLIGVLFFSFKNSWETDRTTTSQRTRELSRLGTIFVIGLALLTAFLSLIMVRPDQDDVFLVNHSTWVSEHADEMPQRDTIFSDNSLPTERPAGVQTSIESLIGAVAAHVPVTAAALTYFAWGPLIAALGVLVTWRLLRGLGARSPALATWAGTAFLIVDGEMHASFGNFFVGRSWQGKTVLLLLVIPMLWHHGSHWGRTGSKKSLYVATLAGVAGVGLSSSAAFLVPVVILAAVAVTSIEQQKPQRLIQALIVIAPAVTAGFYTILSEPQKLEAAIGFIASISPKELLDSGNEPIEILRMVFDRGATTFIIMICIFTSWITVKNRSARLILLAGPIVVFLGFFTPGILDVMNEIGDADAVAWRTLWVLPLPAMVGLVLTTPRAGIRGAPVVASIILIATFLILGTPITSSDNRKAEIVWPPVYDLPQPEQQSASSLIEIAGLGGIVAGPENVDFSVSVMTTKVRSINPRSSYLSGRHAREEFRSDERLILSRGLETGRSEYGTESFENALRVLSPDAVCLKDSKEQEVAEVLINVGYKEIGNDGFCRIWVE
jgi:hypothetical protein